MRLPLGPGDLREPFGQLDELHQGTELCDHGGEGKAGPQRPGLPSVAKTSDEERVVRIAGVEARDAVSVRAGGDPICLGTGLHQIGEHVPRRRQTRPERVDEIRVQLCLAPLQIA